MPAGCDVTVLLKADSVPDHDVSGTRATATAHIDALDATPWPDQNAGPDRYALGCPEQGANNCTAAAA
jgi:hypothetical protein